MVRQCKTILISAITITLWLISFSSHAYETVVTAGFQSHDANWETSDPAIDNEDHSDSSYHLGFRLYNNIKTKHWLGVGLDFDKVLSENLIGYRAIDYQYQFNKRFRAGAFFGAATIDTGLPQNGYYYGLNTSVFILSDKLALQYELKVGDGLARDRLLESDPENQNPDENRPDIFLDFSAHVFSVTWHF